MYVCIYRPISLDSISSINEEDEAQQQQKQHQEQEDDEAVFGGRGGEEEGEPPYKEARLYGVGRPRPTYLPFLPT